MVQKNAIGSRVDEKKRLPKKLVKTRRARAPMTVDQQGLALRYLPMAKALAKPLKASWPVESDEFDSAACLALVEAAQSYDKSKNVKFTTFARYRIWGALRDVQRSLIMSGWQGDMENAPILTSLTSGVEAHGVVLGSEPDRPVEERIESIDAVERWLRKLPKRHAAACREIYINDRTQAEAAKALGCCRSRLSCLHKESLVLLNETCRWKDPIEQDDDVPGAEGSFDHEPELPDGGTPTCSS